MWMPFVTIKLCHWMSGLEHTQTYDWLDIHWNFIFFSIDANFMLFFWGHVTCPIAIITSLTLNCRRAFWDKRISQEVSGDALGEVCSLAGKTFNVYYEFLQKFVWFCVHHYNSAANRNLMVMSSKLPEVVTNKDSQWSRECWPLVVFVSCFTGVGLLCSFHAFFWVWL